MCSAAAASALPAVPAASRHRATAHLEDVDLAAAETGNGFLWVAPLVMQLSVARQ